MYVLKRAMFIPTPKHEYNIMRIKKATKRG